MNELCTSQLKATIPIGVATLIKELTKTMEKERKSVKDICTVQRSVCEQFGLYLPDEFDFDESQYFTQAFDEYGVSQFCSMHDLKNMTTHDAYEMYCGSGMNKMNISHARFTRAVCNETRMNAVHKWRNGKTQRCFVDW